MNNSFVDTNGRQDAVYKKIHPHINDLVALDSSAGLANFELYEYTEPTMEFLDSLKKGLGKGYFNTSLRIFAIREYQFKAPYDKYQIMFNDNGTYIDYKEYCKNVGAQYIFVDDGLYFITSKYKDFITHGTLMISTAGKILEFVTSPGENTIHLYNNLYIKTTLPFIEIITPEKPLVNYTLHDGELSETGQVLAGLQKSASSTFVEISDEHSILSNTALVVYDVDSNIHYSIIEVPYFAWNHKIGVIDVDALEAELAAQVKTTATIISAIVFVNNNLDDPECCNRTPSDLFPEFINFVSDERFNLTELIKDKNAAMKPLDGTDPRLLIDFSNDNEYFSSMSSLSQRVTRELINEEYSKIRNNIDINLLTAEGITFFVGNRYSQVISIYINGRYYHGEFERSDRLGLSRITIEAEALAPYGKISYLEAVVEPLFTRRVDLVKDKKILWGDATGYIINEQKNLIPVHETYGLEHEVDVFINGHYYDKSFYEFCDFNNHKFIFIHKDIAEDIDDVTIVVHSEETYDRKEVTYNELTDFSILDENCKLYMKGQLVPIKYLHNLYNGKYIDVDLSSTFPLEADTKAHLLQLKDNPHWSYLKDSNPDSLLEGFIRIEKDTKHIILVETETIYNYVKNQNVNNTLVNDNYPINNYKTDILLRTLFLYDMISIGKDIRVINGNELVGSDVINKIEEKYKDLVDENGTMIIDCNSEVVPEISVNEIYDRYQLR